MCQAIPRLPCVNVDHGQLVRRDLHDGAVIIACTRSALDRLTHRCHILEAKGESFPRCTFQPPRAAIFDRRQHPATIRKMRGKTKPLPRKTWFLSGAVNTCTNVNVGPLGLEPRTNGLKVRCSNQLSYGPRAILTRGKTRATIAFFHAKQANTAIETHH